MLLLLAVLTQAPALEVRTAAGWAPWPAYGPGAAAARADVLDSALVWTDSADGLRAGAFDVRTPGRALRNSIAILELDPARFSFGLSLSAPDARRHATEALAADASLALVSNTGLFRENGTPQGLVLVDGTRASALAGWLDAVVVIEEGRLRVTDIAGARALGTAASAFQTLPWLVRDGRVALGVSSGLRLSRTHRDRRITLCFGPDERVRLLLSNFEVFGADAGRVPIGITTPEQAALAAGLGCRDAVALDGGISAQIAFRAAGDRTVRWPGWRRVPLLLVARRR